MATKLSTSQWTEILQDESLTKDFDLTIFQAFYSFEKHAAYASQAGRILGNSGKSPHASINLEIGRYAKRIAEYYDINFSERKNLRFKYWDLFFNGWEDGKYFVWQLKEELVEALEETGLTGDVQYPEEIPSDDQRRLFEGAKKTIIVNAYERSAKARQLCIKHYGSTCIVCDFDFEKTYGEFGKGFIHVHHLTPIADIREHYEVDPIKDMRPVCPNCHAMLHRDEPPLTIEELKSLII